VIVVFGGPADEVSQGLVKFLGDRNAVLMTSRDLSVTGWSHRVPEGDSIAVAGGRLIAEEDISAVLVRWPSVFPEELVGIAAEDRQYVSSEMTAFLLGWLSSLDCPVVNRPTETCLMGPSWQTERWRWVAAGLGIPTAPVRRTVAFGKADTPPAPESVTAVTVIGKQCIGSIDEEVKLNARRLAAHTNVDILQTYFDGRVFLGADLMADISGPEHTDAVLELIT
jgi:hypothetical protein